MMLVEDFHQQNAGLTPEKIILVSESKRLKHP
jgi:hypothetical protein